MAVPLGASLFKRLNELFVLDNAIVELGLVDLCDRYSLGYPPSDSDAIDGGDDGTPKWQQMRFGPSTVAVDGDGDDDGDDDDFDFGDGCAFFLYDHRLGVAFWCVSVLYAHAQHLFLTTRRDIIAHSAATSSDTSAANDIIDGSDDNNDDDDDDGDGESGDASLRFASFVTLSQLHALMTASRALLMVNADNYTALHARKRCLLTLYARRRRQTTSNTATTPSNCGDDDRSGGDDVECQETLTYTYANELSFLSMVLSKHPKSGDAWMHRRWCVQRAKVLTSRAAGDAGAGSDKQGGVGVDSHSSSVSSSSSSSSSSSTSSSSGSVFALAAFQEEVRMCERSCDLYPQNYHAWGHRSFLTSMLASLSDLALDLDKADAWTRTHVSDHCGVHHRQVVLMRIETLADADDDVDAVHVASATCACVTCAALSAEFAYVNRLQQSFPGHESLWMHRRFCYGMRLRRLRRAAKTTTTTTTTLTKKTTTTTTSMETLAAAATVELVRRLSADECAFSDAVCSAQQAYLCEMRGSGADGAANRSDASDGGNDLFTVSIGDDGESGGGSGVAKRGRPHDDTARPIGATTLFVNENRFALAYALWAASTACDALQQCANYIADDRCSHSLSSPVASHLTAALSSSSLSSSSSSSLPPPAILSLRLFTEDAALLRAALEAVRASEGGSHALIY
jgi:hypothetical protein